MTRFTGDPLASDKTPDNILTRRDADREGLDEGGRFWLTQTAADLRYITYLASDANVSSPPTEAELIAEFGEPETLPAGFSAIIDDDGAGSTVWLIRAIAAAFWYEELTKAV